MIARATIVLAMIADLEAPSAPAIEIAAQCEAAEGNRGAKDYFAGQRACHCLPCLEGTKPGCLTPEGE